MLQSWSRVYWKVYVVLYRYHALSPRDHSENYRFSYLLRSER